MGLYTIAKQRPTYLLLLSAAFGLIVLNGAAKAQNEPTEQNAPATQESQPTPAEEVTVSAPAREIARRTVGRSPSTAARVEEVTISTQVEYKDLDLKKAADVDELNRRVRSAAEDSCSELDRLFPATRSRRATTDCVNRAVGAATAQITAAVSGSSGRYGSEGRP